MVSRYRKVEVRTWGDEKFRKLSPMPPSGQGLWLYLMTGPHTTAIPGLSTVGRLALAEQLGWKQEAFEKAFAEISKQGMVKADWINRVVWIAKAIKHNQPASPNVVTSWAGQLDLIPECELKDEAVRGLAGAMSPPCQRTFEGIRSLSKASKKPSQKPSGKTSAKAMPKTKANQEQEQEQEQQEQDTLALTANALPAAAPFITVPLNDGSEFPISVDRVREWRGLYPAANVEQELRKYRGWADANPSKRKTRRGILGSVNRWLDKAHDNSTGNLRGGMIGNRAQQRTEGNIANARNVLKRFISGTDSFS